MNELPAAAHGAMLKSLAIIALIPTLLLTGCTPNPDTEPYFDLIATTALDEAGFTRVGKPIVSCGGNTPYCADPAFEVYFEASSSITPEGACTAFLTTTLSVANPVGYASVGNPAGPMPSDTSIVQEFCTSGLDTPMPNSDGTVFYQGTLLYDDGVADEMIKTFTLSREPDGTYRAQLVFGRDNELVYWAFERDRVPTHLTLEEVDQYNENVGIQVKTQEFANSLLQTTEEEALAAIAEAGYTYFVVQRDETATQATGYIPTRILLYISDGVIADAISG